MAQEIRQNEKNRRACERPKCKLRAEIEPEEAKVIDSFVGHLLYIAPAPRMLGSTVRTESTARHVSLAAEKQFLERSEATGDSCTGGGWAVVDDVLEDSTLTT